LNKLDFKLLYKYAQKPALFEKNTASLWDDDHISKSMLEAHLDPDLEAASRKHSFIENSKVYTSLKPGGYFIFDLFTPIKYLQYKDNYNTWEYRESGYWRPYPYVNLYSQYTYPENDTYLDQFMVMDDQDNIEVEVTGLSIEKIKALQAESNNKIH
jgi:hypothetical protein